MQFSKVFAQKNSCLDFANS